MHPLQALEREALGGAGRDVDQEPGRAPALVLVGVDVERRSADLPQAQVVGASRQLAVLEADRGGAVAAPPRLEERERPVGGLEATNHLERRRGCANRRRTIASRVEAGPSLKEPHRVLVVADQQALGLRVVLEHHPVVLAADAGALVAAERGVRRVLVVAVGPHAPGLDRAAHPERAAAVTRPHAGAEPVQRVVGDLERLASSRNVVTASTGPKISSWKTRILLWPFSTVGSK